MNNSHRNPSLKSRTPVKYARLSCAFAIATLKEKGRMAKFLTTEQSNEPLVNYLRIHRRKAGLSQYELGKILGYDSYGAVARHEQFSALPPFLVALGYEIVFRVPVGDIFPGVRETVEFAVERSLAQFEADLQNRPGTGSQAAAVAQKLEWLSQRRTTRDN